MNSDILVRSALLGASAGARSMTPLAVLAQGSSGWVRGAASSAALGELIMDKLPRTPSRLKPAPLAGRIVLGGIAGAAYARSRGAGVVLPAVVAAASALTASYAGALWRTRAAQHSLALPAAVAEDAMAVTLAWVSARS